MATCGRGLQPPHIRLYTKQRHVVLPDLTVSQVSSLHSAFSRQIAHGLQRVPEIVSDTGRTESEGKKKRRNTACSKQQDEEDRLGWSKRGAGRTPEAVHSNLCLRGNRAVKSSQRHQNSISHREHVLALQKTSVTLHRQHGVCSSLVRKRRASGNAMKQAVWNVRPCSLVHCADVSKKLAASVITVGETFETSVPCTRTDGVMSKKTHVHSRSRRNPNSHQVHAL